MRTRRNARVYGLAIRPAESSRETVTGSRKVLQKKGYSPVRSSHGSTRPEVETAATDALLRRLARCVYGDQRSVGAGKLAMSSRLNLVMALLCASLLLVIIVRVAKVWA
jgi:hypothetical protein